MTPMVFILVLIGDFCASDLLMRFIIWLDGADECEEDAPAAEREQALTIPPLWKENNLRLGERYAMITEQVCRTWARFRRSLPGSMRKRSFSSTRALSTTPSRG